MPSSSRFWSRVCFVSCMTLVRAAHLVRRADQTISTSQRVSTYAQSFGSTNSLTTVNQGVTYWLSGGGTHNIYGNVFTNGQIIISQTDYLTTNPNAGGQTCDWDGHTATQGNLNISSTGSISVNDFGSASAPTYDWTLRSFTNYGSLQWCGRGDTGGSTYNLYCDLDCFNYGTIEFGQYFNNIGAAFHWRNAVLSGQGATNVRNIYNNGAFRLTNVVFHNVQNVLGTGCWVLGNSSVLYLEDGSGTFQNNGYGPTFPNQDIYFVDGTSDLHMDTAVYSRNSNFGPQVFGYSQGNAIEFYETIRTSTVGYSYSATTGILTVTMVSGNAVNINIGLGYNPTLFRQARNPSKYNTAGYNAIFYDGPEPAQNVPSTCQPSLQGCADPRQTAGPFASTTSTTATGYVIQTSLYTGTGVVTGPVTSTVAQPSGTALGTVVVYTPAAYVTTTAAYTGTDQIAGSLTTTVAPSGTAPGTVIVYTQAPFITTSLPYTGVSAITAPVTSTIAPSGTAPGTVVVFTPPAFVTTTLPFTGTSVLTGPVTSTIAPSGTAPGTVVVFTPPAFVTTTLPFTGTSILTGPVTNTVAPSGTAPGTVVIFTPVSISYVTVSAPYTGTGFIDNPITTTIANPSGTSPGTVQVLTPTATRPASVTTNIGPNQCVCTPVR